MTKYVFAQDVQVAVPVVALVVAPTCVLGVLMDVPLNAEHQAITKLL